MKDEKMKKQRIKKRYQVILETYTEFGSGQKGRVNCYTCQHCGHITKTVHADRGVTPFMHACEQCGEFALSSSYNDIAPSAQPTQEWFRPTLDECLKMKDVVLLEHILNGGLDWRKI